MPLGTKYPLAIDTSNDLGRWRDNAETTLTAPLGIADATAYVTSTATLPDAPSMVSIAGELIEYSGKTATTLTGLAHGRFQSLGGLPPTPHPAGAPVTVGPSATHLHLLRDAIIATQTMLGPQGANFVGINDDRIRGVMITVASYDATLRQRAKADYVCDGAADQVEINAAINALPEVGGVVRLIGQYFVTSAAILVPQFVTIWGDGEKTTRIETTAPDAAIKVAVPTVRNEHIRLIGLDFANAGSTPTGLDARGMVRLTGQGLRFYGFSTYGVRIGGNMPAYESCWIGALRDLFVYESPTCVRFDGLDNGGPPTGNAWLLDRGELRPTNTASAIAIDIPDGTDNWVSHFDIGYAPEAKAIRLGPNAHRNAIIANRFEDVAMTTNVSGNQAIEIVAGATDNVIAHGSYTGNIRTPHVTGAGINGTVVIDLGSAWDVEQDAIFRRGLMINRPGGYAALEMRKQAELYSRLLIDTNGSLTWFDPADATGTAQAGLALRAVGAPTVLEWIDGSMVALPEATDAQIVTAQGSLTYRGVLAWQAGGAGGYDRLYFLAKDANDQMAAVEIGGLGEGSQTAKRYAQTSVNAADTVVNTTTETAFFSRWPIPPGDLIEGRTYRVTARGVFGTGNSAQTLTLRLKAGATALATTGAVQLPASLTNQGWEVTATIVVRADGGLEVQGFCRRQTAAATAQNIDMVNTAPVTGVNPAVYNDLAVTAQWGIAGAAFSITQRQMIVETVY